MATTLSELLEDIDHEPTQERIQREFYAHQAGVDGAMLRLLEIRLDYLTRTGESLDSRAVTSGDQSSSDDVDKLNGANLFDIGLENPCDFRSRGMYKDSNGQPPCWISIPDYGAFEAALTENQRPQDYIEEHLTAPRFFELVCECPCCSQEDPGLAG